jgi:hypothetical protein
VKLLKTVADLPLYVDIEAPSVGGGILSPGQIGLPLGVAGTHSLASVIHESSGTGPTAMTAQAFRKSFYLNR